MLPCCTGDIDVRDRSDSFNLPSGNLRGLCSFRWVSVLTNCPMTHETKTEQLDVTCDWAASCRLQNHVTFYSIFREREHFEIIPLNSTTVPQSILPLAIRTIVRMGPRLWDMEEMYESLLSVRLANSLVCLVDGCWHHCCDQMAVEVVRNGRPQRP